MKTLPKKGLVVGKFYPPHKGHHFLIDTALAEAEEVDVLVCDCPDYHIPANTRAEWLKQQHPTAHIHIIEDIGKDDDSVAWAVHTKNFLGYAPDIVFSSEDYGDTYALELGALHRKVDKERRHVPVSGTIVRADVLNNWQFLQPAVRADFAIRICVLGAESTGTTTLSKALAKHYQAPWTPEYGRYFSEALPDPFTYEWKSEDFTHIAQIQQAIEQQLAGASNGLLICDTNAFATQLWHERYMNGWSEEVAAIAQKDKVDLYILTAPDIPFEQDGVRDGEHIRLAMHDKFVAALEASNVPYILATGSVKQRLATATKEIKTILDRKITI